MIFAPMPLGHALSPPTVPSPGDLLSTTSSSSFLFLRYFHCLYTISMYKNCRNNLRHPRLCWSILCRRRCITLAVGRWNRGCGPCNEVCRRQTAGRQELCHARSRLLSEGRRRSPRHKSTRVPHQGARVLPKVCFVFIIHMLLFSTSLSKENSSQSFTSVTDIHVAWKRKIEFPLFCLKLIAAAMPMASQGYTDHSAVCCRAVSLDSSDHLSLFYVALLLALLRQVRDF